MKLIEALLPYIVVVQLHTYLLVKSGGYDPVVAIKLTQGLFGILDASIRFGIFYVKDTSHMVLLHAII